MKNKKLTYILVPAVIVIWGAIAYTLFSNLRRTEVDTLSYTAPSLPGNEDSTRIGYELMANYRDPFRYGKEPTTISSKTEVQKKQPVVRNTRNSYKRQKAIRWPAVSYYGIIDNRNERVALLTLDARRYIVAPGEQVKDLKVLNVYPDSISLEYQKQKKTFIKSK